MNGDSVIDGRRLGETLQQYRGRLRREHNGRVDALKLKEGDPVWWDGRRRRFAPAVMKRSDPKYQDLKRLGKVDRLILEADEKRRKEQDEKFRIHQAERDAFDARPEVQAASTVHHLLEMNMARCVDKLTLEEWQALAAKLT